VAWDDLTWWHLTPTGWVEAGSFEAGKDESRAEPPRPPDCLCVLLERSPNDMYSRAKVEERWISPDTTKVDEAKALHGARPALIQGRRP